MSDLTSEEREILLEMQRLAGIRAIEENPILIEYLTRQVTAANGNRVPAVVKSLALKGYLGQRVQKKVFEQQLEEIASDKPMRTFQWGPR